MFNKNLYWLGLVALLTITPILVGNPPITPALGPPDPGGNAPGPSADAVPLSKALEHLRAVMPSPTPLVPMQTGNAAPRLTRVGGEQPGVEQKLPETPITPPTQVAALQGFFLPPVSGGAPSTAAPSPASSTNVGGGQAQVVNAPNLGELIAKSNSALGVEVQRRSPLVGDPRIEGLHFGQIVTHADGGYWFPARIDLDTVVSKLNGSDINNILIIKGPFSVRYGPGFSFLDIESIPTPRSKLGYFDAHGSTSFNYRNNGQGFSGQQSVWGGNTDWGFRITYDAQAAGDYLAGNGDRLPGRYNNQFVNFAYGIDFTPDCSLEVKYLHVQQNGVLIPGLLTGVNGLTTDAFTARFTSVHGPWYDKLTIDAWINNSNFAGDSANPATRAQVPQLDQIFTVEVRRDDSNFVPSPNGGTSQFFPIRLDITTEAHALSWGFREITTWGDPKGFNLSLGTDLRVFAANYNEYDSFNYSVLPGTGIAANLGIPNSRQIDPGILFDMNVPVGDDWLFKAGTRVDFVTNQFLGFGPNVDVDTYNSSVGNPIDRAYFCFAGFITGEYKLTPEWTAQGGYGYAERAPTLTELYAGGSFLGQIQNGLNSIYGNPLLRKEAMHQLTVGLNGKYETFRTGGSAFYAFVPNYITYRNGGLFTVDLGDLGVGVTPINQLQFVNTRVATLWGVDAYGEVDATSWLTPFATVTYVQGWDQTRKMALPGIPPLTGRAGFRIHESGQNPRWGFEYYIRMVATQDLFASAFGEQRTGGFAIHNLRAYWQVRDNFLLLAGVENFGNRYYREHLDLRTGLGVFQPGSNFYVGMKVNY